MGIAALYSPVIQTMVADPPPGVRRRFYPGAGEMISRVPLADDAIGAATLTFSGLQPGSDIVVTLAGTSTELLNVDAHSGTAYAWLATRFAFPTLVDIGIFKVGFVPYTVVRNFSLPYTDAVLPINQVADRNYLNP